MAAKHCDLIFASWRVTCYKTTETELPQLHRHGRYPTASEVRPTIKSGLLQVASKHKPLLHPIEGREVVDTK